MVRFFKSAALVCLLLYPAMEGVHAASLDLLGAGWNKSGVTVGVKDAGRQSPQALRDIETAVGDWNVVLSGIDGAPVLRLVESAAGADVVIIMRTGDRYPLGQTLTRTIGRSCILKSSVVLLNGEVLGREISGAGLRSVARHELGHALGLRHSDDPSDLMYPFFDCQELLAEEDVIISDYDAEGIEAIYPLQKHCPIPDFLFWDE